MPHRKNICAKNYDYRSPGMYFVTVVLETRGRLFGDLDDGGRMHLNDIGMMVDAEWRALARQWDGIALDAHVVMPDHVHGVIVLGLNPGAEVFPSLGEIVGAFKSRTTVAYTRGVRSAGWPPFNRRFWLINYYERILRNDRELETVRRYIEANPAILLERRAAREI